MSPESILVPSLMKSIFKYINDTDLNIIILSAIFHYYFVAIHPFSDGNRIIELITNNNKITQNEIANIIGVNVRIIKRNFKVLIDNSKLQRIGSDKTGYWQILKKNVE